MLVDEVCGEVAEGVGYNERENDEYKAWKTAL
jgi:hypothetical protein